MRYKKHIAIICLVTFLLVPFNKSTIVKAEPITLTTWASYLIMAGLISVTGFTINNIDELQVTVDRLENDLSLSNYVIEKGGKYVLENLDSLVPKVIDVLVGYDQPYIGEVRRSVNVLLNTPIDNISSLYDYSKYTGKDYSFDYDIPSDVRYLDLYFNNGAKYTANTGGNPMRVVYFYPKGYSSSMVNFYSVLSDGTLQNVYQSVSVLDLKHYEFRRGNTTDKDSVCSDKVQSFPVAIPYSGNKDTIKDKDTQYGGSISVDKDIQYGGSISFPVTKPEQYPDVSVDSKPDTGVGDITKPDTGVGDVPSTGEGLWDTLFGWLKALFLPLTLLLEWIGDLLNSLVEGFKNFVIPKEMEKINFTPLYVSFADKFPFCIPFFIIDAVKKFQSGPQEPKFFIDMSSFSSGKNAKGSVGFELDFTEFEKLFGIIRTITLVSFIVSLAFKTRDIIKG